MQLLQAPIVSPFNARSQALDVVAGIDLADKTAIVTGGASGLGVETVRALAAAGARVVMPVRSKAKGDEVAAEIRASHGKASVEVAEMDLADYASVRRFADGFAKSGARLDIVINNAGIMATPERRVMDGIESQFGTNHLGHMLLVCLIAPSLRRGARVVALSSIGHRRSPVLFDDVNFRTTPYEKWTAYGQSKTANALFALELNRRLAPRDINAYSVHPGGIMTNLQREMTQAEFKALGWVDDAGKVREGFKTPAGGASTAVWCATSPLLEGGGGVYCEDCNIAAVVGPEDTRPAGVRAWATDADAAKRLWTLSEKMLGETFDL